MISNIFPKKYISYSENEINLENPLIIANLVSIIFKRAKK